MSKEQLTDKQQAFVDALLDPDTGGNPTEAVKKAGYAEHTNPYTVMNSDAVARAIGKRADNMVALNTVKAVQALLDVLDKPTQLGGALKVKTAEALMDRGGLPKKESILISTDMDNKILPLPVKIFKDNYNEGD